MGSKILNLSVLSDRFSKNRKYEEGNILKERDMEFDTVFTTSTNLLREAKAEQNIRGH